MTAGRRLTRRDFVAGAAGVMAASCTLEGLVLEPRRLSVTRHLVGDVREGVEPLRLVQLTDLHLGPIGSFHERIAEAVDELRPHVVLITGDAVDEERGIGRLETFLSLLPSGGTRLATLGNWEYWSDIDLGVLRTTYERGGCRLLVNEAAQVGFGSSHGYVVGLDDFLAGTPDLEGAAVDVGGRLPSIVVSHCPAWRDEASAPASAVVDLVLSGHTHGGQVTLGGWAPVRPPGSGRYVSGWYRGAGPDLYVSRGLGTSIVPIRLGSVPEIAFFEWYPSAQ